MAENIPRTIPWQEVPDPSPDDFFFDELTTYKREMPRLLEEGMEGQYVLIKGSELVGVYPTWDEARKEGLRRYLQDKHLIHRILREEPLVRIAGRYLAWPA